MGEELFHASFEIPEDKNFTSLLKAEWIPDEPLVGKWLLGASQPGDIAAGGASEVILLSRRTRNFMAAENFTGWAAYPVVLYNRDGETCDGYAGLSITGRCGQIDRSRGELVTSFPQLKSSLRYRGLYFDESLWDGSDLFCPCDDTAHKFVTDRVHKAFLREGIDGLRFTRTVEVEWMQSLGHMEKAEPADGEIVEHTVVYPFDNSSGLRTYVCNSFEEAKKYALDLLAKRIEAHILRGHEIVWSSEEASRD